MPSNIASKSNSSGGGRATAAGVEYQSRIAAYFCVKILAEYNASPMWNLANDDLLEVIECETKNQTDDLLIRTSTGGAMYVNVKHKLVNSTNKTSDFAKAINQLVKQFLHNSELSSPDNKLILITSSKSSDAVKTHLSNLLFGIRNSPGQSLTNVIKNEEERKILTNVKKQINVFWMEQTGNSPSDERIKELLKSVWLEILDVDAGGSDEQAAQTWLNSLILNDNYGKAAWNHLIRFCLTLNSHGGGTNRTNLQTELLSLGLQLKNTKSYREDIKKLIALTHKTFQSLRDLSVIKVGRKEIKIKRPVKNALLSAAESESLVVIGEPGSGKSGVLYDFVEDLINQKRDVIFLAVDKIEATSKIAFHQEFRLEHDFLEVLKNWVGNEPGYLVIDALDASRDAQKAKFINNLLEEVLQNDGRWRVIVSIRKFDLRYNKKLQNLFEGRLDVEHTSLEFPNLRHINTSKLTVEEWLQIPRQHPDFGTLFLQASDELRELLFVPFKMNRRRKPFPSGRRKSKVRRWLLSGKKPERAA